MRESVRQAFYEVNEPWEGVVCHFYADVLGLPTIGVGNYISTAAEAVMLPLRRADGSMATRDEIIADWAAVKGNDVLAKGGWRAASKVVRLHLDPLDVRALVMRKLGFMAKQCELKFRTWKDMPADAQMACLCMCWAMGIGGFDKFPVFKAHLNLRDYRGAAEECEITTLGNPGVKPRNVGVHTMLRNAALVVAESLSFETLYYPIDLGKNSVTLRELPESLSEPSLPVRRDMLSDAIDEDTKNRGG